MSYNNENSGALFINDRRTKDTHPQARGTAEIKCPCCSESTEYWISAWTREVKQGKRQGEKMQSLAFNPKEEQHRKPANPDKPDDSFDDDIPFD